MEHRQILNFLAICEEKTFTRAAERRFLTQQALSRSIQELEKELGVPLFDRDRRAGAHRRDGAALTGYGEALARVAKNWTGQHDYILETLRAMKGKNGALLSLGISGLPPVPDFLADFVTEHPEIRLSLKTVPIDICQEQILEQRLQIGFSFSPIDPELFDAFSFRNIRVNLVAAKTHPLAERKSVRMAELRDEQVIAFTASLLPASSTLGLCRRNGVEPDTLLGSLDFPLVAGLCSTGRYVGFGSNDISTMKDLVEIEIEDEEIYAELFLIVNRRAQRNQAVETFIESAKAWAGNGRVGQRG